MRRYGPLHRGCYLKVEASCVVAADHHRAVLQHPRGGIRGTARRATDDTRVQREIVQLWGPKMPGLLALPLRLRKVQGPLGELE